MTSNLAKAVEEIEDPVLRAKAKRLLGLEDRDVKGVARATDRGDVGRVPWNEATIVEIRGEKYLRTPRVKGSGLDQAPVKKRSEAERVESLAKRLWDTIKDNPAMAPLVLKDIQRELFLAGRPVAYEDLKEAAIELLKRAAQAREEQERKRRGAL